MPAFYDIIVPNTRNEVILTLNTPGDTVIDCNNKIVILPATPRLSNVSKGKQPEIITVEREYILLAKEAL